MKKSGFVITITDLFLSANHRRKKCVVPKNIAFFCVDLHGQELEIERELVELSINITLGTGTTSCTCVGQTDSRRLRRLPRV